MHPNVHHIGGRKDACVVQHRSKGSTLDELHDDGFDPAFAEGVIDRNDRRVGQPGGGNRFTPEPRDKRLVGRQVRVEDFDRNLADKRGVLRPPDLSHAAGGDRAKQPVSAAEHHARFCGGRLRCGPNGLARRGSMSAAGPPTVSCTGVGSPQHPQCWPKFHALHASAPGTPVG